MAIIGRYYDNYRSRVLRFIWIENQMTKSFLGLKISLLSITLYQGLISVNGITFV